VNFGNAFDRDRDDRSCAEDENGDANPSHAHLSEHGGLLRSFGFEGGRGRRGKTQCAHLHVRKNRWFDRLESWKRRRGGKDEAEKTRRKGGGMLVGGWMRVNATFALKKNQRSRTARNPRVRFPAGRTVGKLGLPDGAGEPSALRSRDRLNGEPAGNSGPDLSAWLMSSP